MVSGTAGRCVGGDTRQMGSAFLSFVFGGEGGDLRVSECERGVSPYVLTSSTPSPQFSRLNPTAAHRKSANKTPRSHFCCCSAPRTRQASTPTPAAMPSGGVDDDFESFEGLEDDGGELNCQRRVMHFGVAACCYCCSLLSLLNINLCLPLCPSFCCGCR